jgi:ribosome biogenesis GTPase A
MIFVIGYIIRLASDIYMSHWKKLKKIFDNNVQNPLTVIQKEDPSPPERKYGLTEVRTCGLQEAIDKTEEDFQKKIRPIWEKMKDRFRVQFANG